MMGARGLRKAGKKLVPYLFVHAMKLLYFLSDGGKERVTECKLSY